MARLLLAIGWLLLAGSATAQSADADLRARYEAYQAGWRAYVDALGAAREAGRVTKGRELPADVLAELRAAESLRDAILAEFGARDDLSADSYRTLARLREQARDYAAAVGDYQRALTRGDADAPDLPTLHALCIAAMNSKDDELAAGWMQRTIAAEDAVGGRGRNGAVRTSFYPRALISLGDWERLAGHVDRLAADGAPDCRAAAATFGVVLAVHRGDADGAQRGIDAIRGDPTAFPDHQAWAVLAQLALCVGRGALDEGAFDEGVRCVRDFLAKPVPDGTSASDRNQRRYLSAVEPFLGRPAPGVRVDDWVGLDSLELATGDGVLTGLRGRVVLLDFWQPWCEPCRRAMPALCALQRRYPDELQVLGLCRVEDYGYDVSERRAVRPIAPADYVAHVADFRADMELVYPLGIAASPVNSETYRVGGIPTIVVIDRAGMVRYMSCGAGEPGLLELAVEGVLRARD
ncbi:MAG: redoxin family protein [Planctomycetes bacterium]|nr:redoxin family protein [Planctomycetota bacterium]